MHIVDWDGLQVFLAVARTGRLSTAARRLDVEHTTVSRRLAALEAELAVQSPMPRQQGLIATRIARTTTALYAAKSLIGNAKTRVTSLGSLRGLPLLTYTSAFDMLQEARWFQPLRNSSAVSVTTNSTHALLAAALAGVGIAVLPRFVARQHDDLVVVSDDLAEHDVWLITHPEYRRDPRVRATADFLKRIATGPDGLS